MDRVQTRTDPRTKAETYQYDQNGNLQQIVDRKQQTTTITYDALDRATQLSYAGGSSATLTWDAGNRVTQVVDSVSGTITLTPDSLDRLQTEVTPQGQVSYTYDTADRRISMTVLGQPAVTYGYDNADRLTSLTQSTATVSIGYDDANRRTSLLLPNGVQAAYTYSNRDELASITFTNGGTTLGTLTYSYDAAGRRTGLGGTWARTGLPQVVASATYDDANRQLTWGGQSLTYDDNGNLTADGTNTYTWDARDRLNGMTGATNAAFGYDSFGRRTSKTLSGQTTGLLYDGDNSVQELSGGTVLANILTGLGIDEYFTRTDGSGRRTLLSDALGSILALADDAAALQTQYTYEPFGNTTLTGQPNLNPFQYTGRENDATGLHYFRARYYSPIRHRFLTEDPIGSAGGDPNLYAYVWDDPVTLRDPHGLASEKLDLGRGYTARADYFTVGGQATFEYHVLSPSNVEVGIAGPRGWKSRHGYSGNAPAGIPREVINKLNGSIVDEMRRRALLPPKGTANIKSFIKRFLRPDKANAVVAAMCLVNPRVCDGFQDALACTLNGRKPKCRPPDI
jgi:RHS repeat-associated protein